MTAIADDARVKQLEDLIKTSSKAIAEGVSDEKINEFKSSIEDTLSNMKTDWRKEIDSVKRNQVPYEQANKSKFKETLMGGVEYFNAKDANPKSFYSGELQSKAAVLESTALDNTNTRVIVPQRDPNIFANPLRKEHVRDVVSVMSIDSDSYEYVHEKTFTDNTAMRAVGATVTESEISLDTVRTPLKDVMALMTVSQNLLRDIPALQSFLSSRMVQKYYVAEDDFLFNGAGTGITIAGIKALSTAYNATNAFANAVPLANLFDLVEVARLQTRLQEFYATTLFLSPDSMTRLKITKNSQGTYLDRIGQIDLQILESTFVPTGEFIVGDTNNGVKIIEQSGLNLAMSYETNDNFNKKLVTFRLDKRLGLASFFSQALVKGGVVSGISKLDPAVTDV